MRFQLTISSVLGVTLCAADAFSLLPQSSIAGVTINNIKVVDNYVIFAIQPLPMRNNIMEDIWQATLNDLALRDVISYRQLTWLPIKNLSSDVRLYTHSKDRLIYDDGILKFNERVVVPSALHLRILAALHVANLRIINHVSRLTRQSGGRKSAQV